MRIGPIGWVLLALRIPALAIVSYGGLLILLILRAVEAPFFSPDRPVTPWITRGVCRASLAILGLRYRVRGRPMQVRGAVVANHSTWLDIFALNACQSVYFVSKAEVARWAGIGWLARATGTVFIARDPKKAKDQQAEFEARIRAGHKLLFFPEGTSTDGRGVLPFKPTLFAAFFTHGLEQVMQIQPVTVIYRAPKGRSPRFYGWWGGMDFVPHFLVVAAQWPQGSVEVVFHDPVAVDGFADRKKLAGHSERVVRSALSAALGPEGWAP
ncbi:MAG TPA: lysophospholipid acyltransferase family protein [Albidovulum sp.]|nr:lysophospholipid acyltransferase family protein [Albidovulum sp.]